MAERAHLDWFRDRLAASRAIEPKDPAPILAWRDERCAAIRFKAELIGLDEVRDWSRDAQGNVRHKSGQFFGVEGVRIESGDPLGIEAGEALPERLALVQDRQPAQTGLEAFEAKLFEEARVVGDREAPL